jgi:hypothetical protein
MTIGRALTSASAGCVVVGMANQPIVGDATYWVGADPVFVVGNGTGNSALAGQSGPVTSNAFVIYKNGETKAMGKVSVFSSGTATTPSIVLDPVSSQITVGGQPVLASSTGGYYGIGTATPATALDLVGPASSQIRLRTSTADATQKNGYVSVGHYTNAQKDVALIVGTSASTANTVRFGGGAAASNAATELQFFTAANTTTLSGTQRMTINSSGNVGIGTTTPARRLSVDVDGATNESVKFTEASYGSMEFFLSGGGNVRSVWSRLSAAKTLETQLTTDSVLGWAYGISNSDVAGDGSEFFIGKTTGGANPSLWIEGNGNVGIGSTTPGARLAVNGNATIGTNVSTSVANQVVVGSYNDIRTTDANGTNHTDGVFVVGAGTSSGAGAVNALRVLAGGTVLVKPSGDIGMGSYTNGLQP